MQRAVDRTKLNFRDFLAIIAAAAAAVAVLIFALVRFPRSGGTDVEIYYRNKLIATLPLDEDRTVTFCRDNVDAAEGFVCDYRGFSDFEGPLVQLEIRERSIRISEETSNRHLCSTQGSISAANTPLICLPNSFQAVIIGGKDSGFDN